MPVIPINVRELSGVGPDVNVEKASFVIAPYKPLVGEESGQEYLLSTNARTIRLLDGTGQMTVPPTPVGTALVVQERGFDGAALKYFLVPDVAEIAYTALTEVDPSSLEPEAVPDDAWWLELDSRVPEDGTDGHVLTKGTPANVWAPAAGGGGGGAVESVNGQTGAVLLDAGDVGAAADNDPRLSDARPPTGGAGGVLSGSFPNPGFAVDMAEQSELAAETAARTTADNLRMEKSANLSDVASPATARTNLGLGTAAAEDASDFATAAQGATADTAVQPEDLAAVATSGDAGDLTGTLPTAILPPLAINDVFTVADEAAMLALTAQRGDMAIRTDNGLTYVLSTDSPGTLADWKEVLAAGQVQSVNGDSGVVSLNQDDIGDGATAKQYTATEKAKLAGIETAADVTDAANVAAAGARMTADLIPQADVVDLVDDLASKADQTALAATDLEVAALDAEVDALDTEVTGRGGLPTYAGKRSRPFNPMLSVYNWKSANTRKIRAAIAKAMAGTARCNLLFIGDSATDGRTGGSTTYDKLNAWPLIARDVLGIGYGIPAGGDGLIKPAYVGVQDPRVVAAGAWNLTTNAYATVSAAGATLTFNLTKACTSVDVWYANNGGAFTVSMDGASSGGGFASVTPTGTATWSKVTVTGASGIHTIVITTSSATATSFHSINAFDASGLLVHNAAISGWSINNWITFTSWFQGAGSVELVQPKASQDGIIIGLGGNDIALQSRTPTQMKADMETLLGRWSGGGDRVLALMNQPVASSVPDATWEEWGGHLYDLADQYDLPLIDFRGRIGNVATATTNGLHGDGSHLNAAGYRAHGRQVANILGS